MADKTLIRRRHRRKGIGLVLHHCNYKFHHLSPNPDEPELKRFPAIALNLTPTEYLPRGGSGYLAMLHRDFTVDNHPADSGGRLQWIIKC